MMGYLRDYFESNQGRLIDKWVPYFEIYERHLERFRGTPVNVLEIGVFHGGSLQMWKHYFGTRARIVGVDVRPECKRFEEDGIEIMIGDQSDPGFLASVQEAMPTLDILIDDGGHYPAQQLATFEALFPRISDRGVYICEDLHSNYWRRFGAGPRHPGTFIERAKSLIDQLTAWHTEDPEELEVDDFTLTVHGMHFYDSMLVIEKQPMQVPVRRRTGTPAP